MGRYFDAWAEGRRHAPTLYPPTMQLMAADITV
jgi:hypothetical protein